MVSGIVSTQSRVIYVLLFLLLCSHRSLQYNAVHEWLCCHFKKIYFIHFNYVYVFVGVWAVDALVCWCHGGQGCLVL